MIRTFPGFVASCLNNVLSGWGAAPLVFRLPLEILPVTGSEISREPHPIFAVGEARHLASTDWCNVRVDSHHRSRGLDLGRDHLIAKIAAEIRRHENPAISLHRCPD